MATVTTTVSIIGPAAADAAARLAAGASNVSLAATPASHDAPLVRHERLLHAWRDARNHPPVYTVVPFDPLAVVIEAWASRLAGAPHRLETLIGLTPAGPMPHYFVVDPTVEPPDNHWYHDLVAGQAAARVVISALDVVALRRSIGDLPTGPELPGMQDMAQLAREYVPLPALTS